MHRLPIYVHVADGVYPVCEDTLLMIRSVDIQGGEKVLEVGCSNGIVGMHAAKHGADVTMVDIDPIAVDCSKRNALENEIPVKILQSDLYENVEGKFDIIFFNPPYLPGKTGEGDRRLDGGEGGIEVARRFLNGAKEHLTEDGRVFLLLSSLSQKDVLIADCTGWTWELVGSMKLFFEELMVYKITPE